MVPESLFCRTAGGACCCFILATLELQLPKSLPRICWHKVQPGKTENKTCFSVSLDIWFCFYICKSKTQKMKQKVLSNIYFQTYMVTWFRITDSKSVCKNKVWLPLPALRGTVSECPHLAVEIRKLNKILETTVFRSWTAGHAGLSS